MTLRSSTESEIAVLVGISKAAFDTDISVGGKEAGGPPDYDSYEWHSGLCRDGKIYTYFDDDGEIIGGAILFKNGSVLYIGRIFIVPNRFRQGCGIQLMTEIERMFADCTVFRLDTPIWNVRTNRFYRKCGYTEVRRDDEFVCYEKTIADNL